MEPGGAKMATLSSKPEAIDWRSKRDFIVFGGGMEDAMDPFFAALQSELEKNRKSMERLEIAFKQKLENKLEEVMWEWRSIALVVDRVFFVIYVIIIGLSLVFFFPRPESDPEF